MDNEMAAENLAARINKPLDERFATRNQCDGRSSYRGKAKHRASKGEGAGAANAADMSEGFAAGWRVRREYDGAYKHNSEIFYNGNILTPI
jgi:hypothetical protein